MDNKTKSVLNNFSEVIRNSMNICIEEIDSDFTGWCELGTMLMFRLVRDRLPNVQNTVVKGAFDGNGHFWNLIDGTIVDTTVDQFGKIKTGVVSNKQCSKYRFKEIVRYAEEDLIHMTDMDDVYATVCEELD